MEANQDFTDIPDAVWLSFPGCSLATLADLMDISIDVARARYHAGALDYLVMRTLRGEEWRPSGKVTFDALRVRDILDAAGRARFDLWQTSGSRRPCVAATEH